MFFFFNKIQIKVKKSTISETLISAVYNTCNFIIQFYKYFVHIYKNMLQFFRNMDNRYCIKRTLS